MYHSRQLNNDINSIPERVLKFVYLDQRPSFRQLLEKDNSLTIHTKNIQTLVTEVF